MSDYTIVNLKDVEDKAVAFGHAPDMEMRFASQTLGMQEGGLSYQRLAPGYRLPFAHRHERQEEVFVVLSGTARALIDGEVHELAALDSVRLAPRVMRTFEGGPDGVELLIFGAPALDSPGADVGLARDVEWPG